MALRTLLLTLLASLTLTGCQGDAHLPDATALSDPNDWQGFGRTGGEQHYSPLDQIDRSNVGKLKLAWYHDLPPANTATSPVAAEGKLFITTGQSQIRAFDAATGKLLWQFDAKTAEVSPLHMRLSWGPKGIAYEQDRVFLATQDGRLIALSAKDGAKLWEVREYPLSELRYINGPPRVFDGKVIIGHGGADMFPIRGYATAYDAITGKRLWRFHSVPGDPARGFENKAMARAARTWTGEWWKLGGGGTMWNAFSYDPELDLIYIGVGNGYPYNQALRSPDGGDNLYLASIVAVRAGTGEYVWHYQVCPAEQWDCTATQDMTLATIELNGKSRKVLMQAPKNGFFYVLDRTNGELLSTGKFAKVTWASHIDKESGRPVENPGIRYHGKKGQFEMWPGVRGAHSWLPQSYSPRTGLVYIPVIEGASLIGDEGLDLKAQRGPGGAGANVDPDPDLPGARRGFLKAWDPVAQEARWTVELPGNWPGGTMATAGNLVFQGRIDGWLVAYDAHDGKELWRFATGSSVVAPPISFAVGGRQYVSVITGNGAGGGGLFSGGVAKWDTDYRRPRRVLTFALDGQATLPKPDVPTRLAPLDDPGFKPDAAQITAGAMAYGMSGCLVCHGYNAVGGGSAPDLRTSPMILDASGFRQVVQGGALAAAGMPAFPEFDAARLEAIRYYLRARSQQLGKREAKPATGSGNGALH